MKSASATITPSAPLSGTFRSASMAYERPKIPRDHAALDVLHVAGEGKAGGGRQRRQDAEHHRGTGP
jgi:hypothetical protein